MVILRGSASEPVGALILFLAFYGVHRVMRTGLSKALIAAPAVVWIVASFWSFVPESVVRSIGAASPMLMKAPESLSALALSIVLLTMVGLARGRIGAGVSTLALVALGLAMLLRLLPSPDLQHEATSFTVLLAGTGKGWGYVARTLSALCMVVIGVGPIVVQPLPRRGGAIAGAIGATLLSAAMVGLPHFIAPYNAGALVVFVLLWVVASILSAIGLGAMAGAGAKPAGWIGVGLVVFGIVMIFPGLAIFEKADTNAYGLFMSTPFSLLGIGLALFGWKGAPLELVRKVLGVVLVTAFATGTLAWLATFLGFARVVNSREPWSLAHLTAEPLAMYGLLFWAALLLHLAYPPRPPLPQALGAPRPPIPPPNPQGPPPGWGPATASRMGPRPM